MSPNIWTQCGGTSNRRALEAIVWRVVEAQHVVSTRKLVDDADEQALLESLIDAQKPPAPRGPGFERLHYLLATPFRYPPLRHGSRFGTRAERGVFYGAEALRTAFAEVAYYRLLFVAGTTADLTPLITELTAFRATLRSAHAVDLTAPPFDAFAADISSPTRYTASQALGRAMRADGVEAFRFRSARDVRGGTNVGVFAPTALASKRPSGLATWLCAVTPAGVEMTGGHLLGPRTRHTFPRSDFEVDGVLPSPAV